MYVVSPSLSLCSALSSDHSVLVEILPFCKPKDSSADLDSLLLPFGCGFLRWFSV